MDSGPPNFRPKSDRPAEVVVYQGGQSTMSTTDVFCLGMIFSPLILIACLVLWDGFTAVLQSVGIRERAEPAKVMQGRPVPGR